MRIAVFPGELVFAPRQHSTHIRQCATSSKIERARQMGSDGFGRRFTFQQGRIRPDDVRKGLPDPFLVAADELAAAVRAEAVTVSNACSR